MSQSHLFRVVVCVAASLFFSPCQNSSASIVDLTLDSSASSLDLSLAGSGFQTSALSGMGTIDVDSCDAPFGFAQVTALDLTLDDGLAFSFAAGVVSVNTAPDDVTISLVTPGAAGAVTNGTFSQLGNLMQLGGSISVSDPLNLFGGSQTIDLSTQPAALVDFVDFQITRTGDIKTVSGSFSFTNTVDANGVPIAVVANGTFSASGEVAAVPEPNSAMLLGILGGLLVTNRRRVVQK